MDLFFTSLDKIYVVFIILLLLSLLLLLLLFRIHLLLLLVSLIFIIIIVIIWNSILCSLSKKKKNRLHYLRCGNSLLNYENISMFKRT